MNNHKQSDLPRWFIRPSPTTCQQRSLFRYPLNVVLARLRISTDDLARWHSNGWLSFDGSDTMEVDDFEDPRVWELDIVREIVRSGLGDAQIELLMNQLPKPCAVDPERLAFSFRHGWVEAVLSDEPDPGEIIDDHLDSWLEDCGRERLEELQARLGELLDDFDNASSESTE